MDVQQTGAMLEGEAFFLLNIYNRGRLIE